MDSGDLDFTVSASTGFKIVRQKLKEAEKSLRLDFLRNIRAAMAPLKEQVSKSALQKLPKRGGLADKVAASKYAVRTKATTVMFQMVNPIDIKSFDEGLIRHPVFGNKNAWVEQKVTPGFWSDPINADKPAIVGVIVELMNETIKKIDG